ncbi:MAG: cysteine hydrolase family protein [Candidatus Thorarchaeota archaeon]
MKLDRLEPDKTAILVIDMLVDFVEDDGALVVKDARMLVPVQKQILDLAREKGVGVVYLTDNHMPDDEEFRVWPKHSVAGTRGAQVIDDLSPQKGDRVIPKRRYSGFFGTDLDLTLRESGVENVVLMGVLTDICVMYTSADAASRGYNVFVVTDATASTGKGNHKFALNHMRNIQTATLVDSNQVLQQLL